MFLPIDFARNSHWRIFVTVVNCVRWWKALVYRDCSVIGNKKIPPPPADFDRTAQRSGFRYLVSDVWL